MNKNNTSTTSKTVDIASIKDDDVIVPNNQNDSNKEESNAADRDGNQDHLKADGTPDHRYKGQRDLEDEGVVNPNYTHASTGEVAEDGTHLTQTGKPDRRFQENRALTPEEAEIEGAKKILEKHGQKI